MVLQLKPERRNADRLTIGACVACHATAVHIEAVARTVMFVYFHCDACNFIMRVLKPESSGNAAAV